MRPGGLGHETNQPYPLVASDWSSCLGCVVVVCPCVGHLLCLPYEHCLKLFNYASATLYSEL
uniref:Uncharacterized protein n=1 Tax=Helianthus annuus TaxID=4232 RepID=A0A251V9S3_HELAN